MSGMNAKTKAKSKTARRKRGADTSKISLAGATANNPRTQGSRPKAEDPRKVALAKRAADCGLSQHAQLAKDQGAAFIEAERVRIAAEGLSAGGARRAMAMARMIVQESVSAAIERDTKSALQEASLAILGHDLGRCIYDQAKGDDRAQIIATWETISASHRNWRLRYVGQTGDAKGANIGMIPEPMEADTSLRVDMRTPEEKAAQAVTSWEAWRAKINALPAPQLKWAIRGVLEGFLGEAILWRDKAPTPLGLVAVKALRMLGDA